MSSAVSTALAQASVTLTMFVDLDFASGSLYFAFAPYSFQWNGRTYIGLGNIGSIDIIEEGDDMQMYGTALTLSGVNAALLAIALAEPFQGRPMTIRIAPLDQQHRVISDPVVIFSGRMDTMDMDLGETASIRLTAESRLTDWDKAPNWRFNHEDQQLRSPGDLFFEYTPQMVEKQLLWGVPGGSSQPYVAPAYTGTNREGTPLFNMAYINDGSGGG